MYQYVYDYFLSNKRYDKLLAKIESKMLELDIQGKVNKITLLKNFEALVNDLAKKKSDCLVVVGNDQSVAKILNIVADKNIVLGILPVGNKNIIADFFGMPREEEALGVLAARKIEEIDLGRAAGQYFLSSVEVFGEGISIICNNKYEIKTLAKTEKIGIYNLCLKGAGKNIFNPRDGKLELVCLPKKPKKIFAFKNQPELKESIIKIKKAKILSSEKSNSVLIDSQKTVRTPIEVSLAEKKLKVIVGKDRKF